jgi:hypothetical protein
VGAQLHWFEFTIGKEIEDASGQKFQEEVRGTSAQILLTWSLVPQNDQIS